MVLHWRANLAPGLLEGIGATGNHSRRILVINLNRFVAALAAAIVFLFLPAGEASATESANAYVALVPDYKAPRVHMIRDDGTYLGNFLRAKGRIADTIATSARSILQVDDEFWVATERALTRWSNDGTYGGAIINDTAVLEDPVGLVELDGEIFVASDDKRWILALDKEGQVLRRFGAPHADRPGDMVAGPDGKLYMASHMIFENMEGLVAVWDPKTESEASDPEKWLVPLDPEKGGQGIKWAQALAFTKDDEALVIAATHGRLERWNLAANKRVEVLMDADTFELRALQKGPDGMFYLATTKGLYRFRGDATPEDFEAMEPIFNAAKIERYTGDPFTPTDITVVALDALNLED